MNKTFASLVLAFSFLATPAISSEVCAPGNSYEEIYKYVASQGRVARMYELNATGRAKHLKLINYRYSQMTPPMAPRVADRIIYVFANGQIAIGLYYDDCMVKGYKVPIVPAAVVDTFMNDAGITDDELIKVLGV